MKLSDYVAEFLARNGLTRVFMVTGGGAMHLNDSLGHRPELSVVFNHHEQACAMAAEGAARISNAPAVVCVTTGPGGINALNGVFGAWADSIPMLILSGQVKRETCMSTYPGLQVRQLGDQEADMARMASGICKYFAQVSDPASIRFHLEEALHHATTGRPGPCWLDIPVDVQAADIRPESLAGGPKHEGGSLLRGELEQTCLRIAQKIRESQRPVIMVGKGVRQAGACETLERILRLLGAPVVTAWTGIDMVASGDPLFCGRPGDIGDRAGNFAVQNADLLLVLGTRLGLRQVSYNWRSFARAAYRIHVDVDPAELAKPTVRSDLSVACDLRDFLPVLEAAVRANPPTRQFDSWLAWCRQRVADYPVVLPRHREVKGERVNPYHFMETLFRNLDAADIVVCGNGTANVAGFQAALLRKGQRMFCNTGDASMGYGLPAAIGAATAAEGRRVICLDGDGSLMMNLQELQTVAQYQWPIKIFVLNNDGYASIRQSQRAFFGRMTGEGAQSGVTLPDFVKVAEAFGIQARRVAGTGFAEGLREALQLPGAVLCDVLLDPDQPFEPKLAARVLPDGRIVSPPLEDMFPFLSREELRRNLTGKLADEDER